ncbi:hypothetical protein J6590_001078 [Homalodisca vitripennis]|nr:hypothetical protein J6590_001078 [Homalodisca vitripennis]
MDGRLQSKRQCRDFYFEATLLGTLEVVRQSSTIGIPFIRNTNQSALCKHRQSCINRPRPWITHRVHCRRFWLPEPPVKCQVLLQHLTATNIPRTVALLPPTHISTDTNELLCPRLPIHRLPIVR